MNQGNHQSDYQACLPLGASQRLDPVRATPIHEENGGGN